MPKWKPPKTSNVRARDPKKEQHWRQVIADYQASGLARATYCRENDINPHNMQWWIAEIGRRDAEKQPAKSPAPKRAKLSAPFVRVHVPQNDRMDGGGYLDIKLAGGSSIRVTEQTPLELLSKILRMLEEKC